MALAAEKRVRDHVRKTPVESSQILDGDVYLKYENFQRTGSFKVRGAFNRMLVMSESDRAKGVVAASTGNHGQAVACVARDLNTTANNLHAGECRTIETQGDRASRGIDRALR